MCEWLLLPGGGYGAFSFDDQRRLVFSLVPPSSSLTMFFSRRPRSRLRRAENVRGKGVKPGEHLQNEVQMIDDHKVAVAAGNQYGSAWVQANPDKVVVVYYGAAGKEIRREEFATAPVPQVI